jgi:hypothetical protein
MNKGRIPSLQISLEERGRFHIVTFFLVVLGVELRASHLLGRYCAT